MEKAIKILKDLRLDEALELQDLRDEFIEDIEKLKYLNEYSNGVVKDVEEILEFLEGREQKLKEVLQKVLFLEELIKVFEREKEQEEG